MEEAGCKSKFTGWIVLLTLFLYSSKNGSKSAIFTIQRPTASKAAHIAGVERADLPVFLQYLAIATASFDVCFLSHNAHSPGICKDSPRII